MSSTDSRTLRIEFKPGINRQSTRYAERGSWYDSDKVRFRQGRPENIRGWQKKSATSFDGTARALTTWADLAGNDLASFGTNCKLYVYKGGTFYDITPVRLGQTLTSVINTSVGSSQVLVSAPGHGMEVGDSVIFVSMAATVGGNVFLNGEYAAVSVPNANIFIVSYASVAAATSAQAGLVSAQYLLNCGPTEAQAGRGYGIVPYGTGAYGVAASASNIVIDMRQWSLDQWGQDLLSNPQGGRIYVWDASVGTGQRAQVISASPTKNNALLVSPEDRHLISFGGTDVITSVFDPLLIQWSDTENYNIMTPTVTNTAGSQRLGIGTEIVGACKGKNQIHVWTDRSMHGMTFVGPPFTFAFRQLGSECGLLGPHACTEFGGKIYWMSNYNFFMYDGQMNRLDCTVLEYVFHDINLTQAGKIYAGTNAEFDEVIWLYCSSSATEIDRYVVYNIRDNAWYYGTLPWTTWEDQDIFDTVIGTTSTYLYDIEPHDVYTADGANMTSYVSSAPFDLQDGNDMIYIDRIIPDFTFLHNTDGIAQVEMTTKKYPGSTEAQVKGPFTVSANTTYIPMRARGRQATLKVGVSNGNSGWRMGAFRFNIMADGKR